MGVFSFSPDCVLGTLGLGQLAVLTVLESILVQMLVRIGFPYPMGKSFLPRGYHVHEIKARGSFYEHDLHDSCDLQNQLVGTDVLERVCSPKGDSPFDAIYAKTCVRRSVYGYGRVV